MKIGVGIITMGVRTIHPNIPAKCHPDALIRVQTDHERVGPAGTRNACLKYLYDEGCDFIFMFDDDCYPVMGGWEQYFIDQHEKTGCHFFGLPESFKSIPISVVGEVVRWDDIIGCFSFQTRQFMDQVGYYNASYVRYGYEDVGRNDRARRSGLCGGGEGFPSLLRAPSYIHSEDVYAQNPVPNLSMDEKLRYVAQNQPIWQAERTGAKIYYPYEQGTP